MTAALASLLARAAFLHHADPSGLGQSRRVIMMLECSCGELLTRAAFIHYDNKGLNSLKHYAALKGLYLSVCTDLANTADRCNMSGCCGRGLGGDEGVRDQISCRARGKKPGRIKRGQVCIHLLGVGSICNMPHANRWGRPCGSARCGRHSSPTPSVSGADVYGHPAAAEPQT